MQNEAFASDSPFIDLHLPEPVPIIRVLARHVRADLQPSSLLTMYLSEDGVNYEVGPYYTNDGFSHWPAEPNPAFLPQPYSLGYPQSLNLGCRIGIDVGERDWLGLNVDADICAFGTLNGQPVAPTYLASGNVGFIGGLTGISPRPPHFGGGVWFPNDPQGTIFDWSASFGFGGFCNRPGMRVKSVRFTMVGGGTFGRLIRAGYFRIDPVQIAVAPPAPTPGVTFTPIGDFNAPQNAFDGVVSKPSTACAWAVGTTAWIGRLGDQPWVAPTFSVTGSNNDGFIFGGSPQPQLTVDLYQSDAPPTGPTDGELIDSKVVSDSETLQSVTFTLTQVPKLARWARISHTKGSTSIYVAAV